MRPHVAALYAFARVADDIADEGTAPAGERQARLRAWQARLHRAAEGDRRAGSQGDRRVAHERSRGADSRRDRPLDPVARSADRVVRRSRERVRSGYHDGPLRLVVRRARLLPPIGQSRRPSRAAHRRLSRRRARSIVGRAVHGAAVDQLLAGLRPRLANRPPLRAARDSGRLRRERGRSGAGGCRRRGRARSKRRGGIHAPPVRRRPGRVRRRARTPARRAAVHVARRHAHPRARRTRPLRPARSPAHPRHRGCAVASSGGRCDGRKAAQTRHSCV